MVLKKHWRSFWHLSWLLVYQDAVVSAVIAVRFALWSVVVYEFHPSTA